FLKLSPTVAVVTNIDAEHLDHYGSFAALERTFTDFINKVPFYGLAVLCLESPSLERLLGRVANRHLTSGLSPAAAYHATDLEFHELSSRFRVVVRGQVLGVVQLNMPGRHNVQNALAALAVADFLGVDFDTYGQALAGFAGVGRRFTVRG